MTIYLSDTQEGHMQAGIWLISIKRDWEQMETCLVKDLPAVMTAGQSIWGKDDFAPWPPLPALFALYWHGTYK